MAWLKMHDNSLFAILLRKGWWVSALVAAGVFGVVRIFMAWDFALLVAGPFAAISLYVMYKQLRAPGAGRIAKTNGKLRAMSWDELAPLLEAAYQREGYRVNRLNGGLTQFELVKEMRHTLVAAKRWKADRTGVEPLRELQAAREKHEAHEVQFIATGEVTAQARAFAAANRIRIVEGASLTELMRI